MVNGWRNHYETIDLGDYVISGIDIEDMKDFPQPTGKKNDNEKPRMDLLDAAFLEGVAEVLSFGARKYAAHNWRGGIHYSRLIAGIYRHLGAINRGEDIDPESGKPHVYHIGCGTMFLASMMQTRQDLDDRWKEND